METRLIGTNEHGLPVYQVIDTPGPQRRINKAEHPDHVWGKYAWSTGHETIAYARTHELLGGLMLVDAHTGRHLGGPYATMDDLLALEKFTPDPEPANP